LVPVWAYERVTTARPSGLSEAVSLREAVDRGEPLTEDTLTAPDLGIVAIIPLYNGAKYIREALTSVLAQHLKPTEIVVVDDGSNDDGPRIVAEMAGTHPIRLLHKQNGGQASARNFGVAATTSGLIALLDQDDIWYPDHLQDLAKPFLSRPTNALGWAYCNLDEIDEAGNVIARAILSDEDGRHPKRTLIACLREDMFVLPSASLISRAAFESVGGFDEQLRGYEDDDLFLRLFRAGFDNVYLDKPLLQWRIYSSSASFSPQMAKSRMVYATRLLTRFPDDPERSRFFARDLVAPRFHPQMVAECTKAMASGNEDDIQASFANLQFIAGFLPPNLRHSTDTASSIVSAIIPLYNGELYIEQAITSMLEQTELPAEIIVVDDGSTDHGAQIVEDLATRRPAKVPIRLFRQANGGQSSARNLGARHARGDLIAFLDQDDAWYSNHLEKLTKPFKEPQSRPLGWVYSNLDEVDENGTMVTRSFLWTFGTQHPKRELAACLSEDMYVLPSASVISRRAFLSVGGFDEQLMGYEDDDLFLRLFRRGYENLFIDEPLSQWRIHSSGSSYSWRMARSRMIYAKKLLDEFPDDRERERYFRRDMLAPRFFSQVLSDYRKALRRGDREGIRSALANLRFISKFLRLRLRLLLFVVLPALAYPPLAKVLFAFRGILRTPVLRVFRAVAKRPHSDG
jgi:glycosyltransferase involved in cell wall biosynthesis